MRLAHAVGLALVTAYSLGLALLLAQFLTQPPGAGASGEQWTVYALWAAAFVAAAAGPAGMWWFFGRAQYRTAWAFAAGPVLASGLVAYALFGLRLI